MRRREFLLSGMAAAAEAPAVRFGVIADVHHGLAPDAEARLRAFLEAAAGRRLDFLIQLGDFCHPVAEARSFLRAWNDAPGLKYNVLGNHDMDKATKRETMDALGMKESYYSFDRGGFHFVALDANYLRQGGRYRDFERANYFVAAGERDWVNADQVEWLEADLVATELPAIVFTHQPVAPGWDKELPRQRAGVRAAIARANGRRRGSVVASFSGHDHVDGHRVVEGVDYFHVNSASYFWAGEQYGRMAMYEDALYEFVTIEGGVVTVEGRRSRFAAPTPAERGHPDSGRVTAAVEDRRVRLTGAGG